MNSYIDIHASDCKFHWCIYMGNDIVLVIFLKHLKYIDVITVLMKNLDNYLFVEFVER